MRACCITGSFCSCAVPWYLTDQDAAKAGHDGEIRASRVQEEQPRLCDSGPPVSSAGVRQRGRRR